ncbi:MAG TPA: hypothetical protein VKT51_01610 [Candidatus Eremiobacteraceae bacterium]|nr:hypothetical protein [Candidatus Eremiobacteraceae bacterium]
MKMSSLSMRLAFGTALCAAIAFAPSGARIASAASISPPISYERAVAPLVYMHPVDMRVAPSSVFQPLRHAPGFMPDLRGMSEARYRTLKRLALHNPLAPANPFPMIDSSEISPFTTPGLNKSFNGMADSASTCPYFGGCEPPDMAVASNGTWVVQATNTSIAVYNTSGTLQAGWPKNSQVFFNIPNPPNNCDPNGPFTSDPRALYDPADKRFWVVFLQVEGAFSPAGGCPEQTLYWAAVSQTNNPNGVWNVYAFNMAFKTTNAADYTQVGLDNVAFYFAGNMFNQFGSAYVYAETFAANKKSMEAGIATTPLGIKNLKVGSTVVDTVQPVMVEANGGKYPPAGLFIDSFNINSGGGSCSSGCQGVNVWAMRKPLTAPAMSQVTVSTGTYTLAPLASEPGCTQCIETIDTRITGTPVYEGGNISWSLDTAVASGGFTTPGVFWGQVSPIFTGNMVTGGTLTQSGIVSYSGSSNHDASFGAMMPDNSGDLFMVFDTMSNTIDPSAAYVIHKPTDALGHFEGAKYLIKGTATSPDSRWGDYEAASYEGPSSNQVWFASEYGAAASDWNTWMGRTKI